MKFVSDHVQCDVFSESLASPLCMLELKLDSLMYVSALRVSVVLIACRGGMPVDGVCAILQQFTNTPCMFIASWWRNGLDVARADDQGEHFIASEFLKLYV